MKRSGHHAGSLGLLLAALIVGACGPAPNVITLHKIGESCAADEECDTASGAYCRPVERVCTRRCTRQQDCPLGFDCGLAQPADGTQGGAGATCYRSSAPAAVAGGFGSSCGAFSPDPSTDPPTPCDPKAKSPCAAGFTCRASIKCDAAAYCTNECRTDADCPPTAFCSQDVGTACTVDADCQVGRTCQTVTGVGPKLCLGRKLCARREQCSPCGTSDQCPAGHVCAVDAGGERYCGKLCSADEHCPQAFETSSFMRCVDAGTGDGTTVCQPAQGSCHGASALMDIEPGGQCAWCRPGIPSDCSTGFCVALASLERLCAVPCSGTATRQMSGYSFTNLDSSRCPSGTRCFVEPWMVPASCGATCTVQGACQGETFAVGAGTCYP